LNKSFLAKYFRFDYAYEWFNPKIVSQFPGKKHLAALQNSEASHSYDNHEQLQHFLNQKQSRGNFFVDVDDNVILDLDCAQPLGYNHEATSSRATHLSMIAFLKAHVTSRIAHRVITAISSGNRSCLLRLKVQAQSSWQMEDTHRPMKSRFLQL